MRLTLAELHDDSARRKVGRGVLGVLDPVRMKVAELGPDPWARQLR